MRHEFEVLSAIKCPMFPQAFACWDKDSRTYFATEPVTGRTLGDAISSNELTPPQVISLLAQVAYALCQLHSQGWLHLSLRPAVIVLGKPIRVLDLGHSTRIDQKPPTPFYFAGYSAPELLADGAIDARADIYSIGALLFHAMSGYPIAESGAMLSGWQPETPIAGVPQILHKCLGPLDTRYATMAELHQDLVRLARMRPPCSLRVRLGNNDWPGADSHRESRCLRLLVRTVRSRGRRAVLGCNYRRGRHGRHGRR